MILSQPCTLRDILSPELLADRVKPAMVQSPVRLLAGLAGDNQFTGFSGPIKAKGISHNSDIDSIASYPTKICRICNLEKSADDFFLDRGKLYSKCRDCFKTYQNQLKTVKKNAPAKPQRCECCGKIPNKWACDHYPNTTKFRGWVCWECNNAAGAVGDSYEGAVKLLNYLYQRKT